MTLSGLSFLYSFCHYVLISLENVWNIALLAELLAWYNSSIILLQCLVEKKPAIVMFSMKTTNNGNEEKFH